MPEFIVDNKVFYNPVEFALHHIGGTWKIPILWRLREKVLRYGELKNEIPYITHKMLTTQLRELETLGMIERTVFPVAPPKVEYRLTDKGKEALPVIGMLIQYGYDLMDKAGVDYPKEK
ncbi:winged helix-turn-helix transcriptional regulator [Chitinophaga sp. 22536]|uniref:winged helix-turn-helix transcriptional regulator n=1 Tax=unclassified Chitinophaga TaxID=2619133 RepID=UPI003F85C11C